VRGDYKLNHLEKLFGEPLEIEPACEPSDIIWENRFISSNERWVKKFISVVTVIIMLGVSFWIIFIL
jgi:hypothetical protein